MDALGKLPGGFSCMLGGSFKLRERRRERRGEELLETMRSACFYFASPGSSDGRCISLSSFPEAVVKSQKFPFPSACRGNGTRDAQSSSFKRCDCLFLVPVNEFGRQVHREQRRGSKNTCFTIVVALLGPEESWGV